MATITAVKERINQLSPAGFQILCDDYLSHIGYPNLVALGTEDGTQKTTPGTPDTYFCISDGKYVFAEYTTTKDGLVDKIRKDIEKCMDADNTHVELSNIAEIVYCHTSSNIKPGDDCNLKSVCESVGVKLTLIGIDTLADGLMKYPSIIKEHLHLTIDTEQIQSIKDFVKQYNANALAATLDTIFSFRENELKAIDEAFKRVNIVLLAGSAGCGKTRLALEYASTQTFTNNVWFIHNRSLPLYEDLKLYFEESCHYFIIVDDANQLSELEHVLEYVNRGADANQVKVLITVRDYALDKVKREVGDIALCETISVGTFTDKEIEELVRENYEISNPYYLERIVQIADGNARLAMLAGKIACDANRLDSINDVTELYTDYYGKAMREAGLDTDKGLLISAGIIAFLNAIHLDHLDALVPILEEQGISLEKFKEQLYRLHEQEIIDIYHDKAVSFSEQCFANFILKYVFFDKKLISISSMVEACFKPHRERTIHAINTLMGVFRNTALHSYVKDEITVLWKRLEDNKSPVFFEYVKVFYLLNQTATLLILQEKIEALSPVKLDISEIDTETGKNNQRIDDDIITILGGFSDTENVETALDLFFEYYIKRPDLYMQFYHASVHYFSIGKNYISDQCLTQIQYFTKMNKYSEHWTNCYILTLFMDVASHFLQLEFTPYGFSRHKNSIVLYHIRLKDTEGVRRYRKYIWEQLIEVAATGASTEQVLRILRKYGSINADENKTMIPIDAPYICTLINSALSPHRLIDCVIVQAIDRIFSSIDYDIKEYEVFLTNSKMKLYMLLKGPEWRGDIEYEEYLNKKQDIVKGYMYTCENKERTFGDILCVYNEAFESNNYADLSEGVSFALDALESDMNLYCKATRRLMLSEHIDGIHIEKIVSKLFSMIQPDEVLNILNESIEHNKNKWIYAYYHEIPTCLINKAELVGLYAFLQDDSDKLITSSSNRDIDFLQKYKNVDKEVVIKASRIIFAKQKYSQFMVRIYFSLLFNEHHIQHVDAIKMFDDDISLLEQIYIYFHKSNIRVDHNGLFLYELCRFDYSFLEVYIRESLQKVEHYYMQENALTKLCVFYRSEKYIEYFDMMIDRAIHNIATPTIAVSEIIKQLLQLSPITECYTGKRDEWIRHYIIANCKDQEKMGYLFEAITETSMEWMPVYVELLCQNNDDFKLFKSIPLIPLQWSISDSLVPLYSSWVDNLEKLLPLFPGLRYLKHKIRVEQKIDYLRKRIEETEITDILEG